MAIQRATKRAGKLYIRVFPDKPLTKKPLETRMGKGKGGVELWVAVVKPGPRALRARGHSEGAGARRPSRSPRPSCPCAPASWIGVKQL